MFREVRGIIVTKVVVKLFKTRVLSEFKKTTRIQVERVSLNDETLLTLKTVVVK